MAILATTWTISRNFKPRRPGAWIRGLVFFLFRLKNRSRSRLYVPNV